MRIQIIHNQNNLLRLWILVIQYVFYLHRPINFCSLLSDPDIPFSPKRFEKHKNIADSIALVFIIITSRYSGFCSKFFLNFFRQLLGCLVHADQRKILVKRSPIDSQDIFHGANKSSIRFRRNAPLVFQPRFKFVFFKVWRTASYEILSIYPNSTTLSAKSRNVQRARPFGGSLQQSAIKWASMSPSIFFRDIVCVYGCREITESNPSSTSCLRTFSIVWTVTSKASAIFSSGHAGPSSLWSALSKIRIRVNILPDPRPEVNNFFKVVRSSCARRTIYFFIVFLKVWFLMAVDSLRKYTIFNNQMQVNYPILLT